MKTTNMCSNTEEMEELLHFYGMDMQWVDSSKEGYVCSICLDLLETVFLSIHFKKFMVE